MDDYLLTSESAAEGHPDKMADRIADAIVDAYLLQDPWASVNCECLVKTGAVILAGELSSCASVDIDRVVRTTIAAIGYNRSTKGFDAATCAIINLLNREPAAHTRNATSLISGDQSIVSGYACNETPQLMPASLWYSHRLMERYTTLYKTQRLKQLLPDGKCQVTLRYQNGKVIEVNAIAICARHRPGLALPALREAMTEELIKPVIPARWLTSATRLLINPAGALINGGPAVNCGATGRKTSVDTYGGVICHGGGVLCGKDPAQVERAGAYAARYIAKNIVAAGLAKRCAVQLAWASGLTHPLSLSINTFGTARLAPEHLTRLVTQHFDLSIHGIIDQLDLLVPRYRQTACYGHFGRESFPWELTDKAAQLRDDAACQNAARSHAHLIKF
nr:methionine adenosyltransferase [Mixta intestinalis]